VRKKGEREITNKMMERRKIKYNKRRWYIREKEKIERKIL
jgi:hypothetical protein